MPEPALAVVIVTYNTRDATLAHLASLEGDPEHEAWDVLVIDNDSRDGTLEAIRDRHRWVRTIRNTPQRGFAGAVNQGMALTTAPFVLAVNPDTIVPPGTFARLVERLAARPDVAAVGPLILDTRGVPQRQGLRRPRPLTAFVVLTGLSRVPPFRAEADRYYGEHRAGDPVEVEQLPGTCLLFRRDAFGTIGPLDERFFVYCEDVDWCRRATDAGWRLLFVPEVSITHQKAASSVGASARTIRLYYRSLRAYYAKHHAPSAPAPANAFWYAGIRAKEAAALAANALRRDHRLRY